MAGSGRARVTELPSTLEKDVEAKRVAGIGSTAANF